MKWMERNPNKEFEVLEHETRNKMFSYILLNPGTHFYEVKKHMCLANGTLTHHLNVLIDNGLVKKRKVGNFKKLYPEGINTKKHPNIKPKQRKIFRTIRENPGLTQAEIIKKVEYSQSTVSRLLKELRAAGLVITEYDDKGTRRYGLFHKKRGKQTK